jgi:hypothetical protein
MTQQDAVKAVDRHLQALELRKAGISYARIAEALGFNSPQAAWKAVNSALKKTVQEPADELRTLEVERLDAAAAAIYPSVKQGQYGAIDRWIKIMERRAKLLGLDAPTKTDVTSGGDKITVTIKGIDEG